MTVDMYFVFRFTSRQRSNNAEKEAYAQFGDEYT